MLTTRPRPQFIVSDPLEQSAISGLYTKSLTQYTKITKFALQRLFEECLKEDGQFYKFFEKIVPDTTEFIINEEPTGNLDERHLQVARYYADVQERLPQVLIQDAGYPYRVDSLGGLVAGWNMNTVRGPQNVRVMDQVKIPIEITMATLSEAELEDLQAFMSAILGQLQKFTCGHYLEPSRKDGGVYWQVRLPLQHNMGAKSHMPFHGDPRIQIWQSTCSIEVEFENSIFLQYYAEPKAQYGEGSISLSIPSRVALRQNIKIGLQNHNFRIAVYTNDRRIATVKQISTEYYLIPRRVGTCTLLVTSNQPGNNSAEILAQHDVTIVSRL